MENLDKCKVISRYGVRVNTIDIKAATEKRIIVGNVTDYCLDEVPNHAFALLLEAARKAALLNNAEESITAARKKFRINPWQKSG